MLHLCSRPKNGGQLIILLTAFHTFMAVSVCALYFLAEVRPVLPCTTRFGIVFSLNLAFNAKTATLFRFLWPPGKGATQ